VVNKMFKNKKAIEFAFSKIVWWVILLVFLIVMFMLIMYWTGRSTDIADVFFGMF